MPAATVSDVLDLFEAWGAQHYDEDLSQTDHACQTAALAAADGAGDALIAAALLHDVGHLLELRDGGVSDGAVTIDLGHERSGPRFLGGLFGPEVTGPIALHVAAKRYRCAVEPTYLDGLSPGSTRSLARQGGPMSAEEVTRFEAHRAYLDAVRLRAWDDQGKVEGLEVAPLLSYRDLLEALAR